MKAMKRQLLLMRLFWGIAAFMLIAIPGKAFAHDALGDDELAVANWMLVAALVTVVLGVFMGLWAMRTGQFNNIEQSKYSMLDTAEDFDAIMAEADAREAVERNEAADREAAAKARPGTKAAGASTYAAASEPSAGTSRV